MNNREANTADHPPYCTCVDCCNKRLYGTPSQNYSHKPSKQPSHTPNPTSKKLTTIPKEDKIMKYIGKLLLVLTTLGLEVALLLTSYYAFNHQWSPVWSTLIVLATLTGLIIFWCITHSHKLKYQRPRLLPTFWALVIVVLIMAFCGIQPLATYKDSVINWCRTSQDTQIEYPVSTNTPIEIVSPLTTAAVSIAAIETAPQPTTTTTISASGKYKNFQLGIVYDSYGVAISGSGCYDDSGEFILLINNINAKNPTYAELIAFLRNDNTETFTYRSNYSTGAYYYGSAKSNVNINIVKEIIDGDTQPGWPMICADFAERLHNNAELAGIRAGYALGTDHAFNVFETVDRGLIYIDDTGTTSGPSGDVIITIDANGKLNQKWLFPEQSRGWILEGYVGGAVYYESTVWDGIW